MDIKNNKFIKDNELQDLKDKRHIAINSKDSKKKSAAERLNKLLNYTIIKKKLDSQKIIDKRTGKLKNNELTYSQYQELNNINSHINNNDNNNNNTVSNSSSSNNNNNNAPLLTINDVTALLNTVQRQNTSDRSKYCTICKKTNHNTNEHRPRRNSVNNITPQQQALLNMLTNANNSGGNLN